MASTQPHSDWCACSECDVELRAAAADLERQLDHERALRKFAEERLAQSDPWEAAAGLLWPESGNG